MQTISRRFVLRSVYALLLLTTFQFYLSAEVMILHQFRTEKPESQLEDTLYLTAGTELVKAGISSTRTRDNADYILLTEYSTSDNALKLAYSLSGGSDPERKLAEVRFELHLAYNIDTRIAQEIQLLLQMADIDPIPSADAEIEGLFPGLSAARPEEPHSKGSESSGPVSPGRAAAVEVPPETLTEVPAAGQGIREEVESGEKQHIYGMSLALEGVALFGDVNEYLHYGTAGKFSAGATWFRERMSVSLEAEISFSRVFNDEGVNGGPLYLSMAGAGLKIGTDSGLPYRIACGVSGGAAFITVVRSDGNLTKTVPYGGIGIHALFKLGRGYFIGGEFNYRLMFADVLIPGASPAIILRKEL